jgi:hypothetical protein
VGRREWWGVGGCERVEMVGGPPRVAVVGRRGPLLRTVLTHATSLFPLLLCRYQDRGLPFCYVGFFDGMEEGVMRANVIEAKINDVSVR